MHSTPFRPFVASDPALATEIERWLDRQGYQIAYGHQSARADRGDILLPSLAEKVASERTSTLQAEAA